MFIRTAKTLSERAFAAYPHKVAYGFGRIQGPKFRRLGSVDGCAVGPQNAPLHNMLLLVAYCVPCIHNMLRWSILCTLYTQYATRGAYCVGSVHMLFQWSSKGTQYALLENMSRVVFAFLSNCPLDIHLSILRTLCLKPCPHHNCIIVLFNPHQQHFGDVVSKFGFFPDMKSTFGNRSKEKWGNVGG